MKSEKQLLFVPLVGKTSACRQKEGLKLIKDLSLLPRLTAVLPPQGRENTQGFISSKNVGQALPDNKGCSLRPLRSLAHSATSSAPLAGEVRRSRVGGLLKNISTTSEKVKARMRGCSLFNLTNPSPALRASSPARGEADKRFGFTLIELLVVVLIIGILASVALPQYQKAVTNARMAEVNHYVMIAKNAVDAYLLENGFPTEDTTVRFTGPNSADGLAINLPGRKIGSGGVLNYTDMGGWLVSCVSSYCTIFLHSSYNSEGIAQNNWLHGGMFSIKKTSYNGPWTLFTVPEDLQARKFICEWWKGPLSDGTWFGDNRAKTKCSEVGITQ